MEEKPIKYRIERTKNKHSRAVYRDDTIVIRLARGLNAKQEHAHVKNLLDRMVKRVVQDRTRTHIDPFSELLSGASSAEVTPTSGRTYSYTLKADTKTSARRNGLNISVSVGPKARKGDLHRLLWRTLSQAERERVERLVHSINEQTLNVSIKNVRLAVATSQWGSCSSNGTIMLNTALLFLPYHLLEYVIVHELAHRIHADHSPKYWSVVEKALPSYEEARAELKQFKLPRF